MHAPCDGLRPPLRRFWRAEGGGATGRDGPHDVVARRLSVPSRLGRGRAETAGRTARAPHAGASRAGGLNEASADATAGRPAWQAERETLWLRAIEEQTHRRRRLVRCCGSGRLHRRGAHSRRLPGCALAQAAGYDPDVSKGVRRLNINVGDSEVSGTSIELEQPEIIKSNNNIEYFIADSLA